jgi:DNA-binding response OmpR family regulator
MASILLIDPNENHARELGDFLERQRFSVQICKHGTDGVNELRRKGTQFDIVIIEMTGDCRKAWEVFGHIRRHMGSKATTPGLICTCRGYRGPQMRMRVERLGAKLIYERTE